MKKVGIITICDRVPNYGNRLQNYAVQQILTSLGLATMTYSFEGKPITIKDRFKRFFHIITFYKFTRDKFIWTYEFKRKKMFAKFTKKHINTVYRNNISRKLKNEQDYFVVGSDQVWNPTWYGNNPLKKDAFLLTFADCKQKLCFAPSFGVDTIPEEWVSWFSDNLSSFSRLNVREHSGAEIIKLLTGKDCTVMPDPTMMLTKEQWNHLAKRPKRIAINTPFILTYFIGGISSAAKKILAAEKTKGLRVISILNRNDLNAYITGPEEFIYLISKASLVLTDSFHASVFSIIYSVPFLVFSREGKENGLIGRIYTLLHNLNLQDRFADHLVSYNSIFDCNFSESHNIIEEQRKVAIEYLRNCFHLDNA